MAALLIKNIPPRLHELLKQRAAANRRSLNSEAIIVLESAMQPGGIPVQPHHSAPGPSEEDAVMPETSSTTTTVDPAFRNYGVGFVFDCETEYKRKYQLNR